MSSRLAMMLAIMLLIGSAVTAYFAWTLNLSKSSANVVVKESQESSRKPSADQIKKQTETHKTFDVVFARKAIAAGGRLNTDNLVVYALPLQPPHTYANPDSLAGTRVWRRIAEGEMIRAGHLRKGSDLAATLLPDEHAVAVAVDGVVGTGGLLAPGDSVDVLLYLEQTSQGEPPSAQRVLENVRLLSIVERVQVSPEHTGDDAPERTEFRDKTAVLAVPQEDTTRLMLASSAGTLRLALRSAALGEGGETSATRQSVGYATSAKEENDSADLVKLTDFLPTPTRSEPRQKLKSGSPEPEKATIRIHRGDMTEAVELPQ